MSELAEVILNINIRYNLKVKCELGFCRDGHILNRLDGYYEKDATEPVGITSLHFEAALTLYNFNHFKRRLCENTKSKIEQTNVEIIRF